MEQLLSFSESRLIELWEAATANKIASLPSLLKEVKGDWDELRNQGIKLITFTDKRYPKKLKYLDRLPPILYMLGNPSLLKDASVGILGARDTCDAGLRHATKFGAAAGRLGLVVVSGYAKGVDTEAHLGAIHSNGRIIVVLAEGIARFRKKRQFKDVVDLSQRSLVVSQFYPRQTWHVGAAMERNSVICGLSDAVAVVEAGETGGTIAAGRECLAQGKPLWVIDYDGLPPTAAGNRLLNNEGGRELRNVRDWFSALYNVLTNSGGGRGTRKSKIAEGQPGVYGEKLQQELSLDNLEEQLDLFKSTVRI